jgi:hypothetical protein
MWTVAQTVGGVDQRNINNKGELNEAFFGPLIEGDDFQI